MKRLLIFIIFLNITLFAWEVNTHQALTISALEKNPENLKYFVDKFDLDSKKYNEEIFEDVGIFSSYTYFNYATKGELNAISNPDWKIGFDKKSDYKAMIQAGSILEDSLFIINLAFDIRGRFLNHFYDAQDGGKALSSYKVAFLANSNAYYWANMDMSNKYNHSYLRQYYKKAIISETEDDRRKYQAKLFASTGFLLHLLQDMFVPAHTRNDSHPTGDDLEVFLRSLGGFNVDTGEVDKKNNNDKITSAVNSQSHIRSYDSFEDFYTISAYSTATNFFSSDTIFYENYKPTEYEAGRDYSTLQAFEKYYHINLFEYPNKLAIYIEDLTIIAEGEQPVQIKDNFIKYKDNKNVMVENAVNLLPKAVGTSAGLINYIFRGKIEAKVTSNNQKLKLKNISKYDFSSGNISVYYEYSDISNKKKRRRHLTNYSKSLIGSILKNQSIEIEDFDDVLETIPVDMIPEDKKVTLFILFDGNIGNDEGIAATKLEVILKECDDPSNWEIIGDNRESGTCEYRVNVKNKNTEEIIENVYPFNENNGTVYQLSTGEWVIANCGGTNILGTWSGETDSECYKLEGTDEIITKDKVCSNFIITNNSYSSTDDFNQICKNLYGNNFRQADWYDFVNYSGSRTDLVECLNLEQKRHSWITKGGVRNYSGRRVYFLSYYNHNVPSYYLVHADIDNDFFVLGSWWNSRNVACFKEN